MNPVPLIPRKILFGNPDRTAPALSPNGEWLSWLASAGGVLNVWIAPRERISEARPITADRGRGIYQYFWAHTNRHVLYLQDTAGDENWHIYCVDIDTGNVRDLTPFQGATAHGVRLSPLFPTEIVTGLNNRDPVWHDAYRIDIETGERTLIQQNDRFAGFVTGDDFQLALALLMTEDGGARLYRMRPGGWELFQTIPPEDMLTTGPIAIDKSGQGVYMQDSRGRDTSALFHCRIDTGASELLASDPFCDAGEVMIHPTTRKIQAVAFNYQRQRWQILDAEIEPDIACLRGIEDGELDIVSRTMDDRFWIARFLVDDGPQRFYLYDRDDRSARFLFTNRQALEGLPLTKMRNTIIQARDGLEMVAYYSLPLGADSNGDGIPDKPLPMVLLPHGGPWWRDSWGYSSVQQWLANRGYASLTVNFRGSTGFGKAHTNAGDREWGGKIMDDQVDAVRWAVNSAIADADRTAVFGGSFGGYSTLCGLTRTPELFACGIDLVGPSNLTTFMETIPPYWKPMLDMLIARVGDHRTEEGRALLKAHSPLTNAHRICRPLLIGQGANDPRVKQAESDQIVAAMREKGIPVTYVLYPDEGHGFARPENNMSFNAIAEAFLAKHLGGRCEPIEHDFDGSSLQVLAGAGDVPGLNEGLS